MRFIYQKKTKDGWKDTDVIENPSLLRIFVEAFKVAWTKRGVDIDNREWPRPKRRWVKGE